MPIEDKQRRGLEEVFYDDRNSELLAQLKHNVATQEQKQSLATASGISDDAVLTHLLAANIRAETMAALGVVPLLAVAWADGELDAQEKQAMLQACEAEGIMVDSDCYRLLDRWLRERPTSELLTAWKDFISAAKGRLSPEALSALKEDVISRAEKIAAGSGGLLGSQSVSAAEKSVLCELRDAFGT